MLEQLFFLAILGIIITRKQYNIYSGGRETKNDKNGTKRVVPLFPVQVIPKNVENM